MPWIQMLYPEPGDKIDRMCESAVRISGMLNTPVRFMFNGIKIMARPDDSPEEVYQRYHEASGEKGKVVAAKPKPVVKSRVPHSIFPRSLDELGKVAWTESSGPRGMRWEDMSSSNQSHWRGVARAVADCLGVRINEEP